jgi:hypothetical protein
MNARTLLLAGAVAALAGCNQASENRSENGVTNAAASATKHPTYCFFKDSDTKGWSASHDAAGNVAVKGKALLEDTRYMAALGQPEISGANASLWLTMGPNTNAYGAPGNWWDVAATVPGSSGVDAVTVMCGTKTVAQLKVGKAR